MRPFLMLMSAYILSVSIFAAASHLEVYKGVDSPWVIKEAPFCTNSTLCPENPDYTWESYFNRILDIGGRSFMLGGYALNDSRIIQDFPFDPPWKEKAFSSLSQKVKGKRGSILAWLEISDTELFDETIFMGSARSFLKKYNVTGFAFGPLLTETQLRCLKKVFPALRKLNLISALSFGCDDWQVVNNSGLARIADLNFVALRPRYDDQTPVFNTDTYAKKAIKNATIAGAKPGSIILQVPLLARATYFSSDTGYSLMVYDYNADPKGNGSVIFNKTTQGGYYFFSQTRLVDKIALARQYKLRGIMLEGGGGLSQDLFPWDKSSLLYALLSRAKSGRTLY
ncbi:hypothetical protein FOL47_000787 [Perkinsus chesapeaki]|uniref:Chitinase n=1 Tax=Perkinsus chesapeaki TaxID=330153 RepID=A0A7J6ML45_PERCH|nr:hypothetical protein FOL47_000787 [Perkinsus chesapeaki]